MKIEHIALYVNDLEKTRNFFMKYLGAKSNEGYHNLKTNFRSYFLSFDDGARLEIMNKPEMPDGMVGPGEGRGGMRPGMRPDGMRMEPGRGMRPRPGDGTDNADFSEKAEQMKKREEKMDKKMKKILDDGQYAKWQDMMKERRERQKRELDLQRQRRELGLPEKA